MNITPVDINNQKFRTRFRGFDVKEVDDFLQAVAGELDLQLKENSRLREKILELESREKQLKERKPPVVKENDTQTGAEAKKAAMLRDAEAAMEGMLDQKRMEANTLKEEIEHLKVTKQQLETYFQSFLQFNLELLDTWNKREP